MRLQVSGICKAFGATHALRRARLAVWPGEIHALLGESGAGKSPLLKIVGGEMKADAGLMLLDGRPFAPRNPPEARRAGVSLVCRELAIAPHLTAEENLTLGLEPSGGWGWIDRAERDRLARAALEEIDGGDIPLGIPAGRLPPAQQRRIELARALLGEPRLLALDEPARFLTPVDARNFFTALRRQAERGASILCTHRFPEQAREVCTRYTVLREGETVETGRMDRWTGREGTRSLVPAPAHPVRHRGKVVLELKKATGRGGMPREIDLTLHEGEIFGLTGLSGSGGSRLLRMILGLDPLEGGAIALDGKRLTRRRARNGIAALLSGPAFPESEALPRRSAAENLLLPRLAGFGFLGFLSCEKERMAALDWMEKLGIKTGDPGHPADGFSSGNRRRMAFARLMRCRARALLLDEPARGVEPVAKIQIGKLLGELASEGKAILLTSASPPELLAVCDTLGVMRGGRLAAVRPARDWTPDEIVGAAAGGGSPFTAFPAPPRVL